MEDVETTDVGLLITIFPDTKTLDVRVRIATISKERYFDDKISGTVRGIMDMLMIIGINLSAEIIVMIKF